MTSTRPKILPLLLASMLEEAPGRVRRRLDKNPNLAETWNWNRMDDRWDVKAGDQTVSVETTNNIVQHKKQLRCTCLLAPKCLHILACVAVMEAATEGRTSDDVSMRSEEETAEEDIRRAELLPVTPEMQRAAGRMRDALDGILRVGAGAAGSLVQSALLRAGYECRVAGLPAPANTMLRIVEGVRRLRTQSDTTDSRLLQQDILSALTAAQSLCCETNVPSEIVGTNRREYVPLSVSRLEGWFAEPILTRSGYAGVCIYLLAPGERVYRVIESRPGDVELVFQAYRGGIELGAVSLPAAELCRKCLTVQNLVASSDGRLGKGRKTRWAVHVDADFDDGAAATRFAQPLARQLDRIFRDAEVSPARRRGGWDLVAFEARILGVLGSLPAVHVDGVEHPWRLRIANDDPKLAFRDNLALLARCPGLRLRCVGRLRLDRAGEVDLLAIGPPRSDTPPGRDAASLPRLQLPESWRGRCNMGIDRLQRRFIEQTSRWGVDAVLEGDEPHGSIDDGLDALDRRVRAVILGGRRAVPGIDSVAHRRALAVLRERGYAAAASLVDILAAAAAPTSLEIPASPASPDPLAGRSSDFTEALLACAVYLRAARTEFHRQCWRQLLE